MTDELERMWKKMIGTDIKVPYRSTWRKPRWTSVRKTFLL